MGVSSSKNSETIDSISTDSLNTSITSDGLSATSSYMIKELKNISGGGSESDHLNVFTAIQKKINKYQTGGGVNNEDINASDKSFLDILEKKINNVVGGNDEGDDDDDGPFISSSELQQIMKNKFINKLHGGHNSDDYDDPTMTITRNDLINRIKNMAGGSHKKKHKKRDSSSSSSSSDSSLDSSSSTTESDSDNNNNFKKNLKKSELSTSVVDTIISSSSSETDNYKYANTTSSTPYLRSSYNSSSNIKINKKKIFTDSESSLNTSDINLISYS